MASCTFHEIDGQKITALTVDTTQLAAEAVTLAKVADDAVDADKVDLFISTEQTATGSAQNVAHGLGAVPSVVLVVPTEGDDGAGSAGTQMPDIAEGTHTTTNVVVTVAAGAKFKVLAIA